MLNRNDAVHIAKPAETPLSFFDGLLIAKLLNVGCADSAVVQCRCDQHTGDAKRRQLVQIVGTAHPPAGGVAPDAPVEERFRGRVLSILQRITDPECHEFEIVHKELANPTGLLAEVMRECIVPLRDEMMVIVRELLGDNVSPRRVYLTQMSIIAQCIHVMATQYHHKKFLKDAPFPGLATLDLGAEAIADHIVRFSLSAISGIRRQIENGELTDTE